VSWWLRSPSFLENTAGIFVLLILLRFSCDSLAARAQGKVNKTLGTASKEDATSKQISLHARFTTMSFFFGSLVGIIASCWVFWFAFFVAAWTRGSFWSLQILVTIASYVLLSLLSQSQNAPGVRLPTLLTVLGALFFYCISDVHLDAWLVGSGCHVDHVRGKPGVLGSLFFQRKFFFVAVAVWGIHPVAHNVYSFLATRWYAWKLARYLENSRLTLGDLRDAANKPSVSMPYHIMYCAAHDIWKFPRRGPWGELKRLPISDFIFSPLYVGHESLGYVETRTQPHCHLRVSGAVAISGAASVNHLVRLRGFEHILTFFSGLLFGMWLQFEPDATAHETPGRVAIALACALIHFFGAFSLLIGYDKCTHTSGDSGCRWQCEENGAVFVACGFVFFLLDVAVVPVFITWVRAIWRTPFFGKWLSEWMQLQAFSFPNGNDSTFPRHVYLTDGGHIDNLGLGEPLRRRARVIIVPHCGMSNTHTPGALKWALDSASEDPTIYAEFSPLTFLGGDGKGMGSFAFAEGVNLQRYLSQFGKDMSQDFMVIGIRYSPYPAASELPKESQLQNTWGIILCFANRPAGRHHCEGWGISTPPTDAINEKLRASFQSYAHLFALKSADNKADGDSSSSFSPSSSEDHETFLPGSADEACCATIRRQTQSMTVEEMVDNSGWCCSCCHANAGRKNIGLCPLRCLARLGGKFPHHPTWNQCFTPELAAAYQYLGCAVAAKNEEVIDQRSDCWRCLLLKALLLGRGMEKFRLPCDRIKDGFRTFAFLALYRRIWFLIPR